MGIVNAQYIGQAGLDGKDLLNQYQAGQQERKLDYANQAVGNLNRFFDPAEHEMRVAKLQRPGGLANLEEDKNMMRTALIQQNMASGNRYGAGQIEQMVNDYFSRYEVMYNTGADPVEQKQASTMNTQAVAKTVTTPQQPGFVEEPQDWSVKPIDGKSKDPSSLGHYGERAALGASGNTQSDRLGAMQQVGDLGDALGRAIAKNVPGDMIEKAFSKAGTNAELDINEASAIWDMLTISGGLPNYAWAAKNPAQGQDRNTVLQQAKLFLNSEAGKKYVAEYMQRKQALGPQSTNVKTGSANRYDLTGAAPIPGKPGMAEGGKVTGPTVAVVGEGGEAEYVVPKSKAAVWAAAVLKNPMNPPNPADLPETVMAKKGLTAEPEPDPNATLEQSFVEKPPVANATSTGTAQTALSAPAASAPAATAATGEWGGVPYSGAPAYSPPQPAQAVKSPQLKAADDEIAKAEAKAQALPPAEQLGPKGAERVKAAIEAIKGKATAKAFQLAKASPEFKQYSSIANESFQKWFKEATPEEMSLWGMGDAAGYRDNREAREQDSYWKWKYYELQKAASEGDQGATMTAQYVKMAMDILTVNKERAEKIGEAKMRSESNTYDGAVKFLETVFQAPASQITKGIFGGVRVSPGTYPDFYKSMMGIPTTPEQGTPETNWRTYKKQEEATGLNG